MPTARTIATFTSPRSMTSGATDGAPIGLARPRISGMLGSVRPIFMDMVRQAISRCIDPGVRIRRDRVPGTARSRRSPVIGPDGRR